MEEELEDEPREPEPRAARVGDPPPQRARLRAQIELREVPEQRAASRREHDTIGIVARQPQLEAADKADAARQLRIRGEQVASGSGRSVAFQCVEDVDAKQVVQLASVLRLAQI